AILHRRASMNRPFAHAAAMARRVVVVIALGLTGFAAVAQQPNEDALSPAEKRIPPGHYCKRSNVRITPSETSAHPCDCKYSCSTDVRGTVPERDAPTSLAFCHKNGRRCTCHVEEPCNPQGNALMDMDHHVVAMRQNVRLDKY